jgi:hypothetical protein
VSRALPHTVRDNIAKCRSAAIAAVEAYNRPGSHFRTAQYIVMITLAWGGLLHAIFYKRGERPWDSSGGTGKGRRYVKIDGEPKHWDLSECLTKFHGANSPPERRNVEFLIGLRNKIEHRHLPEFDASLYGECQAALLNLEELLVAEFGKRFALTEQLAVSLQFSQVITAEKRMAARSLARGAAKTVASYIERFRGNLPSTVLNSMKYSFNVFLVPKVANRQSAADAAVQFVRVDEASPEELLRLERLNVLIREKHIPIANLDLLKPGQVVAQVKAALPHAFTMATHTLAWRCYEVRPMGKSDHPERTLSQYCVYDPVHRDWLYTHAWVELLKRDLADPQRYEALASSKSSIGSGGAPASA